MKLYRVTHYTVADGHQGYTWHTSKAEADREAKAWHKAQDPMDGPRVSVAPVDIETNKAGLVDALNKYAAHPDNG